MDICYFKSLLFTHMHWQFACCNPLLYRIGVPKSGTIVWKWQDYRDCAACHNLCTYVRAGLFAVTGMVIALCGELLL